MKQSQHEHTGMRGQVYASERLWLPKPHTAHPNVSRRPSCRLTKDDGSKKLGGAARLWTLPGGSGMAAAQASPPGVPAACPGSGSSCDMPPWPGSL